MRALWPTRIIEFSGAHKKLIDILGDHEHTPSKSIVSICNESGEIKRMATNHSIYINGRKTGIAELLSPIFYEKDHFITVCLGRKSPFIIKDARLN